MSALKMNLCAEISTSVFIKHGPVMGTRTVLMELMRMKIYVGKRQAVQKMSSLAPADNAFKDISSALVERIAMIIAMRRIAVNI